MKKLIFIIGVIFLLMSSTTKQKTYQDGYNKGFTKTQKDRK